MTSPAMSRSRRIRVLSEREFAKLLRERGRRIVFGHGRYWIDHWGFFRLLHFAATIPAATFSRPSGRCWALHALLPDSDSSQANAWSPLHLVRDLENYDERTLDASARKQLRRSTRSIEATPLSDPRILQEQGWQVYSDNARRLGVRSRIDEEAYRRSASAMVADRRRLLIAAVRDGELLGYIETFAVNDTAYLDEIRLSESGLAAHVSGMLHFIAAQLYRRSGLVGQVCAGPPLPERMGVSEFKRRWGMPIVSMPARFWSAQPMGSILRVARPASYYRATGRPARGIQVLAS